MDPQLLDVLVCPLCKGKLLVRKQPLALVCPFDRLAYPVRDGIPVMLAEEAEPLSEAEVAALKKGVASAAPPSEPRPEARAL